MQRCHRGEAPAVLRLHGPGIGQEYALRRREDPSYRFRWPSRDGQPVLAAVRAATGAMTDERCSYCDGHPIDATGEEQIDHFRPKTRPEFLELVCAWDNLFLVCSACNRAKRDEWDEALLRPDVEEFAFERYFLYNALTGDLEPNPAAATEDRHRAARTIELLDLNRAGACIARRRAADRLRRNGPGALVDSDYRFLQPFCAGT